MNHFLELTDNYMANWLVAMVTPKALTFRYPGGGGGGGGGCIELKKNNRALKFSEKNY